MAAALMDAGLSRAEVEEALLAEFRFESDKKKNDQDEIEIEFQFEEPHASLVAEPSKLFSQHGPDSVHSSLSDYGGGGVRDPWQRSCHSLATFATGGVRDPWQRSCHSATTFATETSRPSNYRVESSRDLSSLNDSGNTTPSGQCPVVSSDERRKSPGLKPGAVYVKSDPREKNSNKDEILSEMANFEVALRLESEKKMRSAGRSGKLDRYGTSRSSGSSSSLNNGKLRGPSHLKKQMEPNSSRLKEPPRQAYTLTAQVLKERLAHSRPSLKTTETAESRKTERLAPRQELGERSSYRRSVTAFDESQDEEPLPSWTLHNRPKKPGYMRVSPAPQIEAAPSSRSRRRSSRSGRRNSPPHHFEYNRQISPRRRRNSPPEYYEDRRRNCPPDNYYEDKRRNCQPDYDSEHQIQRSRPESADYHQGRSNFRENKSRNGQPYYDRDSRERHDSREYERRGRHSPPEHANGGRHSLPDFHTDQHDQRTRRDDRPRPRENGKQPVEIEISPNVWMQLRGADETWEAVQVGGYAPAMCLSCNLDLLAIVDAEYVLCPSCRVVSPIMDDGSGFRSEESAVNHGVGLGFKVEDLKRWQDELARGIFKGFS
jgi:hypothetical protein